MNRILLHIILITNEILFLPFFLKAYSSLLPIFFFCRVDGFIFLRICINMYMHVYIHTVMCHKYPLAHCGSVLHLLYKGLGAWKFLSLATLKWKLSVLCDLYLMFWETLYLNSSFCCIIIIQWFVPSHLNI